jgi:hypothetical protein
MVLCDENNGGNAENVDMFSKMHLEKQNKYKKYKKCGSNILIKEQHIRI